MLRKSAAKEASSSPSRYQLASGLVPLVSHGWYRQTVGSGASTGPVLLGEVLAHVRSVQVHISPGDDTVEYRVVPLDAQMPLVELQPQGNGRGNPALPHLHDLECVDGILRGNRSGHNVDHIERRQVLENVRPHIKDWWE